MVSGRACGGALGALALALSSCGGKEASDDPEPPPLAPDPGCPRRELFCDDFDDRLSDVLGAKWQRIGKAGQSRIVESVFLSPPHALEVTVPAGTTEGAVGVAKSLHGTAKSLTFSVAVRVAGVVPRYMELLLVYTDLSTFRFTLDSGGFMAESFERGALKYFRTGVKVKPDVWFRLEIHVRLGPSPTTQYAIDGVPVFAVAMSEEAGKTRWSGLWLRPYFSTFVTSADVTVAYDDARVE